MPASKLHSSRAFLYELYDLNSLTYKNQHSPHTTQHNTLVRIQPQQWQSGDT